jgi:hypothetical protein
VLRQMALFLSAPAALWFLYAVPAYGHGCGHRGGGGHHCRDYGCDGCGWWSGAARRFNPPSRSGESRWGSNPANAQTHEGPIGEIIYLPGATADTAMVELRLLSGSDTVLVRLGPAGFLKQNGLNLKEGDAIAVTGYRVSAADGELLVANEVGKQGKTVRLRDGRGRPAW